jgi:hypothetical protein
MAMILNGPHIVSQPQENEPPAVLVRRALDARLMLEHLDVLEAVATELFHAGWLDGDEIDAVLAQ